MVVHLAYPTGSGAICVTRNYKSSTLEVSRVDCAKCWRTVAMTRAIYRSRGIELKDHDLWDKHDRRVGAGRYNVELLEAKAWAARNEYDISHPRQVRRFK